MLCCNVGPRTHCLTQLTLLLNQRTDQPTTYAWHLIIGLLRHVSDTSKKVKSLSVTTLFPNKQTNKETNNCVFPLSLLYHQSSATDMATCSVHAVWRRQTTCYLAESWSATPLHRNNVIRLECKSGIEIMMRITHSQSILIVFPGAKIYPYRQFHRNTFSTFRIFCGPKHGENSLFSGFENMNRITLNS